MHNQAIPYEIYGCKFDVYENHFDLFKTEVGFCAMAEEMLCFIEKIKERKCLIDIGSLLGIFSLIFTNREGTSAHAIEPSPWCYPKLKALLELNPRFNIQAHNLFLGSVQGRKVNCLRDWYHSVAEHAALIQRVGPKAERVVLEESTLDNLCFSGNIKPDCLKIDVEGYEGEVLKGGREVLKTYKPAIFIEVHGEQSLSENNSSIDDLSCFLKSFGYVIYNNRNERLDSFYGALCRYYCE